MTNCLLRCESGAPASEEFQSTTGNLPEDLGPLRNAVQLLVQREFDVVFFTTSVQVRHLMLVAGEMKLADEVRNAMTDVFVASIGPVTSDELRQNGLPVNMEPSHPKMGFLVSEAAAKAAEILFEQSAVTKSNCSSLTRYARS